jgi:Fe-S-cluster containining protein
LEAEVLLAEAPPFQSPVSGDFCPFQEHNLCTARDPRPLGCRVYFCDPTYQNRGDEITETFLRRLKELAETHELSWRYAPLHHFLNEAGGHGEVMSANPHSTRIPLAIHDQPADARQVC